VLGGRLLGSRLQPDLTFLALPQDPNAEIRALHLAETAKVAQLDILDIRHRPFPLIGGIHQLESAGFADLNADVTALAEIFIYDDDDVFVFGTLTDYIAHDILDSIRFTSERA
jgi:hypothetical protein